MTTFIPMPRDPERSARIREHAMRWYAESGAGAGPVARPVKVRLITNPAAALAYAKAAILAALNVRRREQGDRRR